jgi:hypothetical protein
MCPWSPLADKTRELKKKKKVATMFRLRHLAKGLFLVLDLNVLGNEMNNSTSNFTYKTLCFVSIERVPRMLRFCGSITVSRPSQNCRCFNILCTAICFRDTLSWCFAIDMDGISLGAKFKGGSSTSVFRKMATLYDKGKMEI